MIPETYRKNADGSFHGKRVLMMGLGLHGGGVGTVRFLARQGVRITVTDLRSRKILAPALKKLKTQKGVRYVLGTHRKKDFLASDLIVKNQGVPPHSPYIVFAKKHRIPVTSDIGFFFNRCRATIIGVTGTRGKSTAAYLIYAFLKSSGKKTFLGGNIRKSALEFLPKLKKEDWVVLELSSFQLYDLRQEKKSPRIAVITNIFPDHLNWHKNFKAYVAAKRIIADFQRPNDYLFINPLDPKVRALARNARARVVRARMPRTFEKIVDANLGKHYRQTVALAIAVARQCGVSTRNIRKVLASFRGLEDRQEFIGTVQGVHFVNDTTSTIPEATLAALERFGTRKGTRVRIILIAGGHDKKLDYTKLAEKIKYGVDATILLPGDASTKLKKELRITNYDPTKVHLVKTMKHAVQEAFRAARKGDWIILSPGAASFGLFANEFDRGKQFVDAVNKLKP